MSDQAKTVQPTRGRWSYHNTTVMAERNGAFTTVARAAGCGENYSESEANARLIAAAPEMLAALKALRIDANRLADRNEGGTYEADVRRAIAVADAAIDRAERGRQAADSVYVPGDDQAFSR